MSEDLEEKYKDLIAHMENCRKVKPRNKNLEQCLFAMIFDILDYEE